MPRKGQTQPKTAEALANWHASYAVRDPYDEYLRRLRISRTLKGRDIAGPVNRAKALEALRAKREQTA